LANGSELFIARDARVDAMKLPEIDLFDSELPETLIEFTSVLPSEPSPTVPSQD
jgi:hypothetical protein